MQGCALEAPAVQNGGANAGSSQAAAEEAAIGALLSV